MLQRVVDPVRLPQQPRDPVADVGAGQLLGEHRDLRVDVATYRGEFLAKPPAEDR